MLFQKVENQIRNRNYDDKIKFKTAGKSLDLPFPPNMIASQSEACIA
jgi:hypothetical protein